MFVFVYILICLQTFLSWHKVLHTPILRFVKKFYITSAHTPSPHMTKNPIKCSSLNAKILVCCFLKSWFVGLIFSFFLTMRMMRCSVKWWAAVFAVYRSDQPTNFGESKKRRIPPDMRRMMVIGKRKRWKSFSTRLEIFWWQKSNKPSIGSILKKSGLEGAKEEKDYIESIGYWQPMDSEGCIRSTLLPQSE